MDEAEKPRPRRFGCLHAVILAFLAVFLYLAVGIPLQDWWNRPPTIDPRAAAPDRICYSRSSAIAMQVILYADRYDGWMPDDPDCYVKLFGYPLNSETGPCDDPPGWYQPGAAAPSKSQRYAASVTDFRCPIDTNPGLNRHGIPSSYRIAKELVGRNIKDLAGKRGTVPVVVEVGRRHRIGGPNGPLGRICVYGDLHGEIVAPESSTRIPGDRP